MHAAAAANNTVQTEFLWMSSLCAGKRVIQTARRVVATPSSIIRKWHNAPHQHSQLFISISCAHEKLVCVLCIGTPLYCQSKIIAQHIHLYFTPGQQRATFAFYLGLPYIADWLAGWQWQAWQRTQTMYMSSCSRVPKLCCVEFWDKDERRHSSSYIYLSLCLCLYLSFSLWFITYVSVVVFRLPSKA